MIRPITSDDTSALVELICSSGLFRKEDAYSIQAMLDEYHSRADEGGRQIIALAENGSLAAVAYFTPKEFTDRVWELLMIAVSGSRQRQGLGSRLLLNVEESIRALNGRLLLIETSDRSSFERTRSFYQKHGYAEVARIPDYFTDGDGKVSFIKRL
jgi:ribosomal protein S18 acetylase RimI-like enzyme